MVHFLIKRPIAVTMSFLALLLIGLATTTNLPVSLMPDIDIPVISIRVSSNDMPARQLENTVVKPLRNVLKEVNHVEKLKSESRDGTAWVELRFKHGTPIDLASIEVNEKVDKAMGYLPSSVKRPEVLRASASDIPVFYLLLNYKNEKELKNTNNFLDLSNFAGQVIRKRLEQLPEVALIDMSGQEYPEIRIIPNPDYIQSGAFSISELELALNQNNMDLGNLLINDGQYQYNIRFNTRLQNIRDIENIPVNIHGKVVLLKNLAAIELKAQKAQGNIKFNGNIAISLAVIKQSDAKMASLKKELEFLVSQFRGDYPEIEFSTVRDQSKLLEYSINNLAQSLLFGGLLAFLAMFLFLRERRAPWLIGISIPISLILSLFLFYLMGMSINIISLSGLVLGVGMMIDNSIIVIDNITQHRQATNNQATNHKHTNPQTFKQLNLQTKSQKLQTINFLTTACTNGTNEIIRPLISSVLTTCAVFIPLVFMKGMAGALFYDQAVAVSIGLTVSLVVSITLLPTLYRLFYKNNTNNKIKEKLPVYFHWYEVGLKCFLRKQALLMLTVFLFLITAFLLFQKLPVSRFPKVSQDETVLKIDWNQPVSLSENNSRIERMLIEIQEKYSYIIEEAGSQQYLLNNGEKASISENKLILKANSPKQLEEMMDKLQVWFHQEFPNAEYGFFESDNLFNLAFGSNESPLIVKFNHHHPGDEDYLHLLTIIQEKMMNRFPGKVNSKLLTRNLILIEADQEKLLFYHIENDELYRQIKSAFNVHTIFSINNSDMLIPVSVSTSWESVFKIIQNITVTNTKGVDIPLSGLVKLGSGEGLKTIIAGKEGEYFPIDLNIKTDKMEDVMYFSKSLTKEHKNFDVQFEGSILSNNEMLGELLVIIGISLLLLYFILAAQFESFILPIIVLLEIPIDLFGVFLFLKLFGAGINIMSAIGIIVMTGIIINDSILKIDTINKQMDAGDSLIRAIIVAGRRRLKPILMTSVTTILAMAPFLFQKGMGAELQKPLALAIIGGMLIGTFVSLYFIPILFYLLKKSKAFPR